MPTFTCSLQNNVVIRGLKDGGCQKNFITEKLAISQNLKVIKEVSIVVNGFNTSQPYDTKLVEAHINFGGRLCTIQAFCIPSIKIHLKLPGLSKVVQGFVSRGYNLADQKLLESHCDDELKDIDFVLGTGSAHCIIDSTVSFGETHSSVYSQTPFGVMLLGDVEQILEDLEYLPYAENPQVSAHSNFTHCNLIDKYVCYSKVDEGGLSSDSSTEIPFEVEASLNVLSDDGKVSISDVDVVALEYNFCIPEY